MRNLTGSAARPGDGERCGTAGLVGDRCADEGFPKGLRAATEYVANTGDVRAIDVRDRIDRSLPAEELSAIRLRLGHDYFFS